MVNPVAGKGHSIRTWKALEPRLKELGVSFDATLTPSKNSASGIAAEAVRQGYDRIVAVGGDGTVHEVVNGMAGAQVTFGVVPAGTGNDFARTLGMPTDIPSIAKFLADGVT
ncbi:MAG: diacylglycerol/lipid kinase family protein, partial [Anaerolineae bacterium]